MQAVEAVADHPRVCGEKQPDNPCIPPGRGSPPRVRGKVFCQRQAAGYAGITPACAGKRVGFAGCDCLAEDHPRVCGEKQDLMQAVEAVADHPRVCGEKLRHTSFSVMQAGSPPRVRGKGLFSSKTGTVTGITPACAGKSGFGYQSRPEPQDHPRVCGEKHTHCCPLLSV